MKVAITNKGIRFSFLTFYVVIFSITTIQAQMSYTKNFVYTVSPKKPGIQTIANLNGLPPQQKAASIEYIDGLGRKIQTVIPNGKSLGVDVILPIEYDEFGRVAKEYLPFTSANSAFSSLYRDNWVDLLAEYYGDVSFSNNELPDANPYSINVFDNSPLNRVKQTFAPGDVWAGSYQSSAEKSVNTSFMVNDPLMDDVKNWDLDYSTGVAIPKLSTSYSYIAGDLVKTIITDVHGKSTEEFKDKNGNVILKKVQLADNVTGIYSDWLWTYYIYDDLNRLRYVLPPKVIETFNISNSWVLTQDIIYELCFWYVYDDRGRLITKHVPGAHPVQMLYDKRDRLVFTQDGNMLTEGKWLLTLYDFINRPNVTALWTQNYAIDELREMLEADPLPGNEDFNILNTNLTISNKPSFIDLANLDILTITLYDSYENSICNAIPFKTNFITPYSPGTVTDAGNYAEAVVLNKLVPGKITATKVKVLDPNISNPVRYLSSLTYYDKEYRAIQTIKENLLTNVPGKEDVVTTQYDFTNQILGTYESHYNTDDLPINLLTKNVFDIQGKITDIYKGINSNIAEKLIVHNDYDNQGRLKVKITGDRTIAESFQEYTYNIRNWIRGVNMTHLENEITPSSGYFFGYELGYNTLTYGGTYNNPQFNGNIGAMIWASAGKAGRDMQGIWMPQPNENGIMRKYEYTYDNTNRLTKADFTEYKNSFWINSEKDFTSATSYDANGNILTMSHMGVNGTSVQQIDNLVYNYYNNEISNRLLKVEDWANDMTSTLGDFIEYCGTECPGRTGEDYVYDLNGNLTIDRNKVIINENLSDPGIIYNYLNLPKEIKLYSQGEYKYKGFIHFIYDALGNKLQKIVTDKTVTPEKITTTNYTNGFLYENDVLKQISHEEGRIRWAQQPNSNRAYIYDWFLKDHLGNTRLVLTEELEPIDAKIYKATFETEPTQKVTKEDIAKEKELFGEDVLSPTRNSVPSELKDADHGNQKCSLLRPGNSNGKTPYKILKVAAGDKFTIGVKYYYRPNPKRTDGKNIREDIFKNLINGILGIATGINSPVKEAGTFWEPVISPAADGNALQSFANPTDNENKSNSTRPRAYLNYILMDTTMKFIKGGALRVGDMDAAHPEWKNLVKNDIQANKTGYFLVYISNEDQQTNDMNAGNVYFDDLVIITNEGPVMEENHYYPFGLLMDAISTSGSGKLANKYKYNGKELNQKEFSDGTGLDWYDYGARMYDQQIGRWNHIDAKAGEMRRWSPYNFAFNNPIRYIDSDGFEPTDIIILGTQAKRALQELNTQTNLILNMDENGKVYVAGGSARTHRDHELLDAIENQNTILELKTTSSPIVEFESGHKGRIFIGAFAGSRVEFRPEYDGSSSKVKDPFNEIVTIAEQFINMDQADKEQLVKGASPGRNVLHEIMEGYYGAIEFPGYISNGSATIEWEFSHNKAIDNLDPFFPNYIQEKIIYTPDGPQQWILNTQTNDLQFLNNLY